jgi:plastocyanin
MRKALAIAAMIGVGALVSAPAWAGVTQAIDVVDDDFEPATSESSVGAGGFVFDWGAGTGREHNVRQDRRLFSSGPKTDSGQFVLDQPSAGTFPYHCQIHGNPGSGMHGTLEVRPSLLLTPSKRKRGDLIIAVAWAESTDTGDQFDVKYRVNDGKWKLWKQNTAKPEGAFGRNDKPVEVNPTKTYRFKVRSEKKGKPDRRSGFSPPLVVQFT